MNRTAIAALLLALSVGLPGCATTKPSRAELISQYAAALDVEGMMRERSEAGRAVIKSQLSHVMEQFRTLGLSDAARQEMQGAAESFGKKVMASVDPAEASRVFMAALAAELTDEDLREGIAESRTAHGQRVRASARAAGRVLQEYYASTMGVAMQAELPVYVGELRSIAERSRAAPATH